MSGLPRGHRLSITEDAELIQRAFVKMGDLNRHRTADKDSNLIVTSNSSNSYDSNDGYNNRNDSAQFQSSVQRQRNVNNSTCSNEESVSHALNNNNIHSVTQDKREQFETVDADNNNRLDNINKNNRTTAFYDDDDDDDQLYRRSLIDAVDKEQHQGASTKKRNIVGRTRDRAIRMLDARRASLKSAIEQLGGGSGVAKGGSTNTLSQTRDTSRECRSNCQFFDHDDPSKDNSFRNLSQQTQRNSIVNQVEFEQQQDGNNNVKNNKKGFFRQARRSLPTSGQLASSLLASLSVKHAAAKAAASTAAGAVNTNLAGEQQSPLHMPTTSASSTKTTSGVAASTSRRRHRYHLSSMTHDLRRALSVSGSGTPSTRWHPFNAASPVEIDDDFDADANYCADDTTREYNSNTTINDTATQKTAHAMSMTTTAGSDETLDVLSRLSCSPRTQTSTTNGASATTSLSTTNNKQNGKDKPLSRSPKGNNTSTSHRLYNTSASSSASISLNQDHNTTYKLIIFGSSAVGKTSLIQRFLYGQCPVSHKPTVEELHSNKYIIPGLGEIYLEILDTSGTFEFPAMRRLSIKKGNAFILVYSCTDPASWDEVRTLRDLILEEKRPHTASSIISSSSAATANVRSEQRPLSSNDNTITSLSNETLTQRGSGSTSPQSSTTAAGASPSHSMLHRMMTSASVPHTTPASPSSSSLTLRNALTNRRLSLHQPMLRSHLSRASPVASAASSSTNGTTQGWPTRATPIVVVANKCDVPDDQVQVRREQVEPIVVDEWGDAFVECSALKDENVDAVFQELLRQARAPERLSDIVISNSQERRQSLPASELSSGALRGLRARADQAEHHNTNSNNNCVIT